MVQAEADSQIVFNTRRSRQRWCRLKQIANSFNTNVFGGESEAYIKTMHVSKHFVSK